MTSFELSKSLSVCPSLSLSPSLCVYVRACARTYLCVRKRDMWVCVLSRACERHTLLPWTQLRTNVRTDYRTEHGPLHKEKRRTQFSHLHLLTPHRLTEREREKNVTKWTISHQCRRRYVSRRHRGKINSQVLRFMDRTQSSHVIKPTIS